MQEKVVMEGESLGYVLGAMALTFSPWCWGSFWLHQRWELRVTAGHAPRIPISEMKTLSFSEIEGFIPSHTFKNYAALIQGQPLFSPSSSIMMEISLLSLGKARPFVLPAPPVQGAVVTTILRAWDHWVSAQRMHGFEKVTQYRGLESLHYKTGLVIPDLNLDSITCQLCFLGLQFPCL